MIKLKEKWIDDDEKIYYYIEYYDSNNKLEYYWWDDDYVTDDNLIESLNRKHEKDSRHTTERANRYHFEGKK